MARTEIERERDNARVEQALLGKLLPPHDRRIHAKVVGVMARNSDGSSRQDIVDKMKQFEMVELVRNPQDEYDTNAIKVMAIVTQPERRCRGKREPEPAQFTQVQCGHIDAGLAAELAPRMDLGEKWGGIVTSVSGFPSRGVSLMLLRLAQ